MGMELGAFADMFKVNNIWKDFDKFFNSSDYTDAMAYNQLTAAQTQAVQQYPSQYNQGLGNLLSGQNSFGLPMDDLAKKYQAAQAKSLMPAPKVNKKAENEAWLDSKITEVSYAL